jgi:hypothetical protein
MNYISLNLKYLKAKKGKSLGTEQEKIPFPQKLFKKRYELSHAWVTIDGSGFTEHDYNLQITITNRLMF